MIAPLRRTHRRTFALLAVALPLVFAAGLAARRPPPAGSPLALEGATSRNGAFVLRVSSDLHIRAEPRALHPDPLLYWSETAPADELPAGAQLLGPLTARARYRLPTASGYVILYSGGHGRVVDFAPAGAQP
jgi:hypothetical protein